MKYVIEGEDLENVLRENQIRIKRGTLKVYPLDEDVPATDAKDVVHADEKAAPVSDSKDVNPEADDKDVIPADEKAPAGSKAKKPTKAKK